MSEQPKSIPTDPSFLRKQPDLCAAFHLKVFARPISPSLLPTPAPAAVKKSRKPTMTRARPSTDALTQLPARPPSRPPSDTDSTHSQSSRTLGRSLSARVSGAQEPVRSRSRSSDPSARVNPADLSRYTQPQRGVARAPSGKDLFKNRQMTFTRKISSATAVKGKERESQGLTLARSQSQAKIGLLGRKTSDPRGRRNSEGEQCQCRALLTSREPGAEHGAAGYTGFCDTFQTSPGKLHLWTEVIAVHRAYADSRTTVQFRTTRLYCGNTADCGSDTQIGDFPRRGDRNAFCPFANVHTHHWQFVCGHGDERAQFEKRRGGEWGGERPPGRVDGHDG